ncbi:hypothetical protein PZH32_10950 [Adlercreutzia equolifaciens]|uniref:hypothetical protein n=1 Tax=Adlercreutzia equolifaciens TaxID=446660 RepID=UPI0023B19967|nr:hypothetical protein [Adlercreutzia equolifaciens]MDE8703473.1 hypothetical protein [Adlercreutzia equolifaciens]
MTENNTDPRVSNGYTEDGHQVESQVVSGSDAMSIPNEPVVPAGDDEAAGFALQAETLSDGEPARVTSAPVSPSPADADERAGALLQQQELSPQEPVATAPAVAPAANPVSAGYSVEGRQLEQQTVSPVSPSSFPTEPVVPYGAAPTASQAYQAAYGAPVPPRPTVPTGNAPQGAGYNPHAAATVAAYQKTRSAVDPRRVFLICGIVVGAVMVLFGLCMLAFHTPNVAAQAMDAFQLGQQTYQATGATSQEILKTGFSLLLIGFGATDICAFGAKLFAKKGADRK